LQKENGRDVESGPEPDAGGSADSVCAGDPQGVGVRRRERVSEWADEAAAEVVHYKALPSY